MSADDVTIWAVVPAAGTGQRMRSSTPKQYLQCHGKAVLQHSIERLLEVARVEGVVVALHPDDRRWSSIRIESDKPVLTITGGAERADSVRLALETLQRERPSQAVLALVHDAVRPCVSVGDIDRLIDTVISSGDGALLASRVRDTMKRADDSDRVAATVDREGLWHAQTPQLFPLQALLDALRQAAAGGREVTDEASAMEQAGHAVRLVEAGDTNIKITRPDDLALAAFYLSGGR